MTKPFHVYAIDGFESAHASAAAALRAAKRGAKSRRVLYTVVKCDLSGATGAGHGTEIWSSNGRPVGRKHASGRNQQPQRILRATPELWAQVDQAVAASGLTWSDWARQALAAASAVLPLPP